MSESRQRSGGCVCGAVTFTAENVAGKVSACHCKTCRQWGGGPFIDAKPHYYAFDNNTQNMTGEELFAQFAPPAQ